MTSVRALAAAGLLLTGCFYVDPIVVRPRVKIKVVQPSVISRGDMTTLEASFDPPDAGTGTYDWKIFACAAIDANGTSGCDGEAFFRFTTETANTVTFPVRIKTMASQAQTGAIEVELQARSDRGAVATGTGQTGFGVGDALPVLEPGVSARTLTVGAPIDLFVRYSDADDGLDDVKLEWTPQPPTASGTYLREDLVIPPSQPPDTVHRTVGIRLIPGEPGGWTVKVTGTDPAQRDPRSTVKPPPVERDLMFTVAPDQPPCLAQWQPIAPPAGTTLPITAPTVFQVPLVDDDLDAYPAVLDAPQFGTAVFAWSILPPGASARQVLAGATGNHLDFDPAAFTRGDIVELRVEVFDRHATAMPCDDGDQTCSITASTDCIQRQTWRVEVR